MNQGSPLLIIGFISVLLFAIVSVFPNKSFTSVEAKFTDASTGGLAIVPASCPSDPHYAGECSGTPCPNSAPTTGDSGGYVVTSGASQNLVNRHGISFCISNAGGNKYFVPANSPTELQRFRDAIPRLPGASVQ